MKETLFTLDEKTGLHINLLPQKPSYYGYIQKRNAVNPGFYKTREKILREQFKAILAPALRGIARCSDPVRVLDVGCGNCVALNALEQMGISHELHGLDIDRQTLHYAETTSHLTQGLATQLPYHDRSFNLVISTQTIEHMNKNEIIPALREVERVLAPDGVFYLETPNPESLEARLMGKEYPAYLPEHLTLISPKSLKRLLSESGFADIKVATRIEADQQVNELWEIAQRVKIPGFTFLPWKLKLGLMKLIVGLSERGSVTVGLAKK